MFYRAKQPVQGFGCDQLPDERYRNKSCLSWLVSCLAYEGFAPHGIHPAGIWDLLTTQVLWLAG